MKTSLKELERQRWRGHLEVNIYSAMGNFAMLGLSGETLRRKTELAGIYVSATLLHANDEFVSRLAPKFSEDEFAREAWNGVRNLSDAAVTDIRAELSKLTDEACQWNDRIETARRGLYRKRFFKIAVGYAAQCAGVRVLLAHRENSSIEIMDCLPLGFKPRVASVGASAAIGTRASVEYRIVNTAAGADPAHERRQAESPPLMPALVRLDTILKAIDPAAGLDAIPGAVAEEIRAITAMLRRSNAESERQIAARNAADLPRLRTELAALQGNLVACPADRVLALEIAAIRVAIRNRVAGVPSFSAPVDRAEYQLSVKAHQQQIHRIRAQNYQSDATRKSLIVFEARIDALVADERVRKARAVPA